MLHTPTEALFQIGVSVRLRVPETLLLPPSGESPETGKTMQPSDKVLQPSHSLELLGHTREFQRGGGEGAIVTPGICRRYTGIMGALLRDSILWIILRNTDMSGQTGV